MSGVKFLFQHRIGSHWLVAEEYVGAAKNLAILSIRQPSTGKAGNTRPGKRLVANFSAPRNVIYTIAYGLIDIANAMLPEQTYATSDVFGGGDEDPPRNDGFCEHLRDARAGRDTRAEEPKRRWAIMDRRLPILQRCQRVLESCDSGSAEWLEDVLIGMERTGKPPVLPTLALSRPRHWWRR